MVFGIILPTAPEHRDLQTLVSSLVARDDAGSVYCFVYIVIQTDRRLYCIYKFDLWPQQTLRSETGACCLRNKRCVSWQHSDFWQNPDMCLLHKASARDEDIVSWAHCWTADFYLYFICCLESSRWRNQ